MSEANPAPDFYDEDEPYDPEEDDLGDECGRTGDGTCMLAGTEFCDFDCPYRDSLK